MYTERERFGGVEALAGWLVEHRRLALGIVGALGVVILGVFVSVPAALVLVLLLALGFAFVWRAGYTSSALTTWSRSRFDDESQNGELDWMGNVGKTKNGKSDRRRG